MDYSIDVGSFGSSTKCKEFTNRSTYQNEGMIRIHKIVASVLEPYCASTASEPAIDSNERARNLNPYEPIDVSDRCFPVTNETPEVLLGRS